MQWLAAERDSGLTLPVHLGIPGAVDPARLLRIGSRLGVGASLRYLRKNTGAVARMLRRSALGATTRASWSIRSPLTQNSST